MHRRRDLRIGAPHKTHRRAPKPHKTNHMEDIVDPTFICPITQDIMKDPVVAADGRTYERAAIVEWINKEHRSPITNAALSVEFLVPNFSLRDIMEKAGYTCVAAHMNSPPVHMEVDLPVAGGVVAMFPPLVREIPDIPGLPAPEPFPAQYFGYSRELLETKLFMSRIGNENHALVHITEKKKGDMQWPIRNIDVTIDNHISMKLVYPILTRQVARIASLDYNSAIPRVRFFINRRVQCAGYDAQETREAYVEAVETAMHRTVFVETDHTYAGSSSDETSMEIYVTCAKPSELDPVMKRTWTGIVISCCPEPYSIADMGFNSRAATWIPVTKPIELCDSLVRILEHILLARVRFYHVTMSGTNGPFDPSVSLSIPSFFMQPGGTHLMDLVRFSDEIEVTGLGHCYTHRHETNSLERTFNLTRGTPPIPFDIEAFHVSRHRLMRALKTINTQSTPVVRRETMLDVQKSIVAMQNQHDDHGVLLLLERFDELIDAAGSSGETSKNMLRVVYEGHLRQFDFGIAFPTLRCYSQNWVMKNVIARTVVPESE